MYCINVTEKRTNSFVIRDVLNEEEAILACKKMYEDGDITLNEEDIVETTYVNVANEPNYLEIIIDAEDCVVWREGSKYVYGELEKDSNNIVSRYKAILVASLLFPKNPNCSRETLSMLFDNDACGIKQTEKGRVFLWYKKGERIDE